MWGGGGGGLGGANVLQHHSDTELFMNTSLDFEQNFIIISSYKRVLMCIPYFTVFKFIASTSTKKVYIPSNLLEHESNYREQSFILSIISSLIKLHSDNHTAVRGSRTEMSS